MSGKDEPIIPIQTTRCPATGLPITSKPEWTDIRLVPGYAVTFCLIGEAILLVSPKGNPSENGIKALLEKRDEVIHAAGLSDKKYAEIRDYGMVTGAPSKAGRVALANFLLQEGAQGHLQGFWVFRAPLMVGWMIQAGVSLHKSAIPVGVTKDYKEAVKAARNTLWRIGVDTGLPIYPLLKKDGWTLDLEEYGIAFELIGDDILYTVARGKLKEPYVPQFIALHEKVIHEAGLDQKGYFYRIINWEKFEWSSWKARRMYIEGLREINRRTPCKLVAIFGLNKFMKTLVGVSSPFLSNPVLVANDLQESLEMIQHHREVPSASKSMRRRPKKVTYTPEQLQGFANEMLQVIGGINWDQAGISLDGISDEHPMKTVLDALAIVKLDLDNLLQEKEKSQKSLQESEILQRTLLENLPAGVVIIDPVTRIIESVNDCAAAMFGLPAQRIVGHLCHAFLCPAKAGACPVCDLGMEIDNAEREMVCADGTHRPVLKSIKRIHIQGQEKLLECFVDITAGKQAEAALKTSLSLLNAALESTADGILIVDREAHITSWNQKFADMWRIPADLLSNHIDEPVLNHVARQIARPEVFLDRVRELYGQPEESSIDQLDLGDGRIFKRYSQPQRIGDDIVGRVWSFLDITDQKRAEEALRRSEERYRNILESIEDGYFEVDLSGNFTFFNSALCAIFGYPKDELLGMNDRAYMDALNAKKVARAFKAVYASGCSTKGFEYAIIRKDGGLRHLEVSVSLIRNQDDTPTGFRGIARDVTQRKLIELELEKHRNHLEEMISARTNELTRTTNFLENIFNSSLDGIVTTDMQGTILYTSPRIKDILGYEQHEVMGKGFKIFLTSTKNEAEKIIEEVITKGQIPAYELKAIKKSGATIILNLSTSLLRDEHGDIIGTTSVYRDVTEERKMAEAIRQEKIKAEAANKAKSQFLANMSHEIRTPLNGILGMAEICLETALDEEQQHIVGTINKEAHSLLGIINNILDFSKIEAGKLELEHIPFDLNHLLEDLSESFSYQTRLKGLEFISFIAPGTPTRLVGDPGRLRQILRNLIGNAIKFTPQGTISVMAEPEHLQTDRVTLKFQVKDTGIGIPKDKQAIVFESFTQADGSTTRKYGGTGLGITISKELAELMGGQIGAQSEEGAGSTFWFSAVFTRQNEATTQDAIEQSLNDVRMLVVDDNRITRQTITAFITSWGAVSVEAADAHEALALLNRSLQGQEPFDLVLSDLNMPEMNGFDLAREVKRVEGLSAIPIIIFTAFGNPGDGKICRDIGIAGYLTKPIKSHELRRSIEIVLGSSKQAQSVRNVELVTRHYRADVDHNKIRILLVEDYPVNREIARKHLEKAGFQVDVADDGRQALEAFQRKRYDLILMDIQMPVMDGYQATRSIRELESARATRQTSTTAPTMPPRVPIIAMSAHAMQEHKALCLEAGMDDFLAKPLTRQDLLAMTAKWLSSSAQPSCSMEGSGMGPLSESGRHNSPNAVRSPMDLERALEEFEGDKTFLTQVIDGFIMKLSEQIATMRTALSSGDAETLRKEAHAIKGGAANLTAKELARIAFEIECKGKSHELAGAAELLDALEMEFAALSLYVKEHLPKIGDVHASGVLER